MLSLRKGILLAGAMACAAASAQAQSMTPMRGEIDSYSDEFAFKVYPRNIYTHSIDFTMQAYDQNFKPVEATIWPKAFSLGAGGTRAVTVIVGFGRADERKVRVCAESVPFPHAPTLVKAQICGRFLARRQH